MPDLEEVAEAVSSNKKWVAIGIASLFTACAGLGTYDIVPAQNFGVRMKFGQMKSDEVAPGIYAKLPFFESYKHFSNNTVILDDIEVGKDSSTDDKEGNTKDRNRLTAQMRFHFRIDPKVGLIAMHVDEMSSDNGKDLLSKLMNQSWNAVVGNQTAATSMSDPNDLVQAFSENLKWRVAQNNVPIRIDTIELLRMGLDANVPTQIRVKPNGDGWEVKSMAGPAAVSVPHATGENGPKVAQPAPLVTEAPAQTPAPVVTASAAPAPSASAPRAPGR